MFSHILVPEKLCFSEVSHLFYHVDAINLVTDNVSVFTLASEKLRVKFLGYLSDNKGTMNIYFMS